MQALPRHATAPRLAPEHVRLDEVAELSPTAVASDELVTEQHVARLELAAHSSEFVELASLRIDGGTLADSDWYRTNWVDVALDGLDAANAQFTEAGLKRVAWRNCRMTGLVASGCTVEDTSHTDCLMGLATLRFANLQRVTFEGCDLAGADFTGARLTDVTFSGCRLEGTQFHQAQCTRVVVDGGEVGGLRGLAGLRGASFRLGQLDELAVEMARELGLGLLDA